MPPIMSGATVASICIGAAIFLLSPNTYWKPNAAINRQQCYAAGVMHGDDNTDSLIIGIPDGPCRQSYDAGRAYVFNQEQQGMIAAVIVNSLAQSGCANAQRMIASAENYGRYDEASRLRAMIASDCE